MKTSHVTKYPMWSDVYNRTKTLIKWTVFGLTYGPLTNDTSALGSRNRIKYLKKKMDCDSCCLFVCKERRLTALHL